MDTQVQKEGFLLGNPLYLSIYMYKNTSIKP